MKQILAVVAIATLALFTSCSTNKKLMEVTGTVERLEMSTFQYGTHTIKTEDSFYAIKSKKVDLNDYNAKIVTIVGEKIEGYPVDGGPVYIDVVKVKK